MHLPTNLPAIQPVSPIETPSIASASIGSSEAAGQSSGLAAPSAGGVNFSDILNGAINEVEGARNDANASVQRFLSGDGDDLHSTILAGQRADLEFQMFMQVRNKVVLAYQEVMKMQM